MPGADEGCCATPQIAASMQAEKSKLRIVTILSLAPFWALTNMNPR